MAGPADAVHSPPPRGWVSTTAFTPLTQRFITPSAINPFSSSGSVAELLNFFLSITLCWQLACENTLFTLFNETGYFCLMKFTKSLDTGHLQRDANYSLLTQEINRTASVTTSLLVSGICWLLIMTGLVSLFTLVLSVQFRFWYTNVWLFVYVLLSFST